MAEIATNLENKLFFHLILENKLIEEYEYDIFSYDDVKKVYGLIKNYYNKYGKMPDTKTILNENQNQNNPLNEKVINSVLDKKEYENTNIEYLKDKFKEYREKRLLEIKLQSATDLFRQGKYDKLKEIIRYDELNYKIDKIDYKNASKAETERYRNILTNSPVDKLLDVISEDYNPNKTYEEKKYLFYPLLKENQLCILFGATGEGKSVLAIEIANQIANGSTNWSFFRVDTEPQKVLYIDFELGASSFQHRYKKCKLSPNLIIKNIDVGLYNTMIGLDNRSNIKVNKALDFIEALTTKNEAKVIFIDNLSNIADQVEQATEADRFISDLYGRLKALNLTIIFLGHTPKIQDNSKITINQLKGSSSLTKTFESVIGFKRSSINKNISYIKQLKTRQLDYIFDDKNVAMFEFNPNGPCGWSMDYIGKEIELNLNGDGRVNNGRPEKYSAQFKCQVLYDVIEGGEKINDILEKYNISKNTFRKWRIEYEKDENNMIYNFNNYKKSLKNDLFEINYASYK